MTLLLALIAGAGYCLGFAPFDWWPLTLLAMGALFALLQRSRVRGMWLAWWFGLGKYGFGASWVYVSINVYGQAPPWLAGALVVLFVAGLSMLFCLPFGYLFDRVRQRARPWSWHNVLMFAGAWALLDWVSMWLLTGFPWLLPGYAFMHTPLANIAPVLGVLGLSLVVALCAGALAALVAARRVDLPLLALALGGWVVGVGLSWVQWVNPASTHSVALVQGNIDQNVKWLPEQAVPNIRRHSTLTEPHWGVDLIMWPEAAITLYPRQAQPVLANLNERAVASGSNLVLGIPGLELIADDRVAVTNTALALGLGRGQFAKQHLVPFGEYVPLESLLRGLIAFFDLPMSSSVPGPSGQSNLRLSFAEAAMAICYEVAYPESMRRQASTAGVLLTISNDTWFGASIGPLQHMQIARMRALENGRWLLRATNNGVTGIADHRGRLQVQLPQFEAAVLRGSFQVMSGRTPYSYAGHYPVLVVLLLMLGLHAYVRRAEATAGA